MESPAVTCAREMGNLDGTIHRRDLQGAVGVMMHHAELEEGWMKVLATAWRMLGELPKGTSVKMATEEDIEREGIGPFPIQHHHTD